MKKYIILLVLAIVVSAIQTHAQQKQKLHRIVDVIVTTKDQAKRFINDSPILMAECIKNLNEDSKSYNWGISLPSYDINHLIDSSKVMDGSELQDFTVLNSGFNVTGNIEYGVSGKPIPGQKYLVFNGVPWLKLDCLNPQRIVAWKNFQSRKPSKPPVIPNVDSGLNGKKEDRNQDSTSSQVVASAPDNPASSLQETNVDSSASATALILDSGPYKKQKTKVGMFLKKVWKPVKKVWKPVAVIVGAGLLVWGGVAVWKSLTENSTPKDTTPIAGSPINPDGSGSNGNGGNGNGGGGNGGGNGGGGDDGGGGVNPGPGIGKVLNLIFD